MPAVVPTIPGWRSRSPTHLHVRPLDLDRAAASVGAARADTIEWALYERDNDTSYWLTRFGAMLPADDEHPLQIDALRDGRRLALRIPLVDARTLLGTPLNLAAWVEGEAYDEVRHRLLTTRRSEVSRR